MHLSKLLLTAHFAHCSLLKVPAFAKINLNLRVLGKRADGYHEICTVFQTVSLHDDLYLELADEIGLTCSTPEVLTDDKNLIVRAANRLRERFSVRQGAKINLEKRIPSPGGLGGGSANAAIALLALVKLWKIETNKRELAGIAATLGADVPFFLFGGTALGTGLGTEIELLPDIPPTKLLIVTPNTSVPTNEAYKMLDASGLTDENSKSILAICRLETSNCNFLQTRLDNDFEKTVFRWKPEIARVKNTLLAAGAINALMSGSGASVFGIFGNETQRRAAFDELTRVERQWRVFSCETVSQIKYENALSSCYNLPN